VVEYGLERELTRYTSPLLQTTFTSLPRQPRSCSNESFPRWFLLLWMGSMGLYLLMGVSQPSLFFFERGRADRSCSFAPTVTGSGKTYTMVSSSSLLPLLPHSPFLSSSRAHLSFLSLGVGRSPGRSRCHPSSYRSDLRRYRLGSSTRDDAESLLSRGELYRSFSLRPSLETDPLTFSLCFQLYNEQFKDLLNPGAAIVPSVHELNGRICVRNLQQSESARRVSLSS